MTERRTEYKWFWAWDFEIEEKWLNEMAMQGWALVEVGYAKFTFERTEPGEYTIRLEMHDKDLSYEELLEDDNIEVLGQVLKWKYMRKKSEYGSFDVFSDIDSRINHMNKICTLIKIIIFLNLLSGLTNAHTMGWINLLLVALLAYGLGKLEGKKELLTRERELHE
ncbi:MAG: DUF2812 domain-containing protein [Erysipelotrichaceae bacterium]|nr:DUF2812 domain-containing protein [Erysipelotrichaceae bacterium]